MLVFVFCLTNVSVYFYFCLTSKTILIINYNFIREDWHLPKRIFCEDLIGLEKTFSS